jgi:hypothetical protein
MRMTRALLATALATSFLSLACSDTVSPVSNSVPPDEANAAVAVSQTPVISNFSVTTKKKYVIASSGLTVGSKVYIDRSYITMSPLPAMVQGATYILTANDDKIASPKSTNYITFSVDRDVTVYVAHDARLALPSWLRTSFVPVGAKITNTDYYGRQTLVLYKRSYAKGTVTLGSNVDTPANGNMYMVMIVPAGTASPTTDNTTQAVTSQTPAITNFSVATKKKYVVASGVLRVGSKVYIDRTYVTMSPLPSTVQGATYILTADDDKVASPKSSNFMSFTVDRSVTVYVAHDTRLALPRWLQSSFVAVSANVTNTDYYGKQTLALYKRSYAKGTVTLGSNVDTPGNGNMYMVMIVSASAASAPATDTVAPVVKVTSPTASAKIAGAVTLTATASDNVGVVGVQFEVDGKAFGSEDVSSPYSVSWSSIAVANGSHTIGAVARDAAGNKSTASVQVSVQNVTTSQPPPATGGTGTHAGWYVAPGGTSGGSGTAAAPWSLATALAGGGGKIQPGDTVWLRGGTYPGDFTSTLTGSAAAPITVRQYPGERATVDGSMLINGSYTWYWDFEVANTNTTTQDVIGVSVAGANNKFIDLVSHDHSGNGFFLAESAGSTEVYGSIIYNNGFHGSTSTSHGHGIYFQNVTGAKLLADNILFNQYGYNLHGYGAAGHLVNITLDGNVSFNAGSPSGKADQLNMLVGGGEPVTNLLVQNNLTWDQTNTSTSIEFGYPGAQSASAVIKNNYFVGGAPVLEVDAFTSFTFSGNTLVGTGQSGSMLYETGGAGGFSWTGNSYYGNSSAAEWTWDGGGYTFASWRSATGLGSGDVYAGTRPTATKVVVEPSAYQPGRANVVVYNWSGAGSISVDLSSVLRPGDKYEIHNAQNFFGAPVESGTYGGGTVSLPLSAVTPPTPITGWQAAVPNTGTRFAAFVVLRPTS